jgi:hypothetical protein
MLLTITIEMNNEAFGDDGIMRGAEVAYILQKYNERMTDCIDAGDCCSIHDSNGNRVGLWDVTAQTNDDL